MIDLNGEYHTNDDISVVDKTTIPDHTLLVGGFPCQDYSVSQSLKTSKGIEGKKGVLWWSIRDILEAKNPPFVLLENVDRLIKSPAKQRGRDFGIILACFRDLGYSVEWRVINAADYGLQQRRRRVFIFAYKNDTQYGESIKNEMSSPCVAMSSKGFFAKGFPIEAVNERNIKEYQITDTVGDVSATFQAGFENAGFMCDGIIYTAKTTPIYKNPIPLGEIKETGVVDESFFILEERLYYSANHSNHSDETEQKLSAEAHRTWQYVKGAKKIVENCSNRT